MALARLIAKAPAGNIALRKLARAFPNLRHRAVRTVYGTLICDLGEPACLPLLKYGEYPHWRQDFERLPIGPESIVLDIGANIGVTARMFATRAKQVHAFEPSPRALRLLRANVADFANITVHPEAISNSSGTVMFEERESVDLSSIAETGIEVPCRTIDSLGLSPDLIKIDVEGYEHRVLQGARATLGHAPVILFEALNECAREYCEKIILEANPRYRFDTLPSGMNHLAMPA